MNTTHSHNPFIAAAILLTTLIAATTAQADPAELARRIAEGNERFAQGDHHAAAQAYEAALNINSQSPTALYNLAMARLALSDTDPTATQQAINALSRVAAMPGAGELARRAQYNLGLIQARNADAILASATSPAATLTDTAPTLEDAIAAFAAANEQLRTALRDEQAASPNARPGDDLLRSLEYTRRRLHEAQQLQRAAEQLQQAMNEAADRMDEQAEQQEQQARQQPRQQQTNEQPQQPQQEQSEQPEQQQQQQQQQPDQSPGAPQPDPQQPQTPNAEEILDALRDAQEALQQAREARRQAGTPDDPNLDDIEQRLSDSQDFARQFQELTEAIEQTLDNMTPEEREQFHTQLAEQFRKQAEQLRDQQTTPTPPTDTQPQSQPETRPDEQQPQPATEEQSPQQESTPDPDQSDQAQPEQPPASDNNQQLPPEPIASESEPGKPSDEQLQQQLREILEREANIREQLENYRRSTQPPTPTRVEKDW